MIDVEIIVIHRLSTDTTDAFISLKKKSAVNVLHEGSMLSRSATFFGSPYFVRVLSFPFSVFGPHPVGVFFCPIERSLDSRLFVTLVALSRLSSNVVWSFFATVSFMREVRISMTRMRLTT